MTSRFAYGVNALRSQLALSPVLTGLGVLGVVAGESSPFLVETLRDS